jgi:hypothetical protein
MALECGGRHNYTIHMVTLVAFLTLTPYSHRLFTLPVVLGKPNFFPFPIIGRGAAKGRGEGLENKLNCAFTYELLINLNYRMQTIKIYFRKMFSTRKHF